MKNDDNYNVTDQLNESENSFGVKPQSPGTLVGKQTPVLYTSDKGLFIRTFDANRLEYEIKFCDLEKWTGRKESIGLTPDSSDSSQQKSFNKSVRFVESKVQNRPSEADGGGGVEEEQPHKRDEHEDLDYG